MSGSSDFIESLPVAWQLVLVHHRHKILRRCFQNYFLILFIYFFVGIKQIR